MFFVFSFVFLFCSLLFFYSIAFSLRVFVFLGFLCLSKLKVFYSRFCSFFAASFGFSTARPGFFNTCLALAADGFPAGAKEKEVNVPPEATFDF